MVEHVRLALKPLQDLWNSSNSTCAVYSEASIHAVSLAQRPSCLGPTNWVNVLILMQSLLRRVGLYSEVFAHLACPVMVVDVVCLGETNCKPGLEFKCSASLRIR